MSFGWQKRAFVFLASIFLLLFISWGVLAGILAPQFILFVFFLPVLIGSIFLGWQKKIKLKHNDSGIQKHTFVGYSWTYFFFGFFVPIFRGEIAVAFFHFIFSLMTFGIFQLIMPFLYNKQYSTRLLNDSWSLDDSDENNQIARQKIGIAVN